MRDAVLLNAAAALAAFDERAGRLHDALAEGLGRAAAAVDDGRAVALLERWVAVSRARKAAAAGLVGAVEADRERRFEVVA